MPSLTQELLKSDRANWHLTDGVIDVVVPSAVMRKLPPELFDQWLTVWLAVNDWVNAYNELYPVGD